MIKKDTKQPQKQLKSDEIDMIWPQTVPKSHL